MSEPLPIHELLGATVIKTEGPKGFLGDRITVKTVDGRKVVIDANDDQYPHGYLRIYEVK